MVPQRKQNRLRTLPNKPGVLTLGADLASVMPDWLTKPDGDPFVTYTDQISGERTELSVATMANWTAKTANHLQVEDAGFVHTDTDGHWVTVAVALAAWRLGAAVVVGSAVPPADADVLTVAWEDRSGPDDLAVGAGFGGRLSGGQSLRSYVDEIMVEPDEVDADDPDPMAVAVLMGTADLSASVPSLSDIANDLAVDGRRTLLTAPIDSAAGLVCLAGVLLGHGSMILGRGLWSETNDGMVERLIQQERIEAIATSQPDVDKHLGQVIELPDW